jgi:hypothetical protein
MPIWFPSDHKICACCGANFHYITTHDGERCRRLSQKERKALRHKEPSHRPRSPKPRVDLQQFLEFGCVGVVERNDVLASCFGSIRVPVASARRHSELDRCSTWTSRKRPGSPPGSICFPAAAKSFARRGYNAQQSY